MIVTFHKLEDELNDFAYGEDEQGHLIGGKLADDVQYIYKTLSDDYERYYGTAAKLFMIQRVMENADDADELKESKDFKKITKTEIFDIVSAYAFCYGIVYAWEKLNPGVSFR